MTQPHRTRHRLIGWDAMQAILRDFYHRLKSDDRLAPFFAHVTDIDAVATRIARFWWHDLGGAPRIAGEVFNPHAVHRHFGVTPESVDAWLEVFASTLRDHLPDDTAAIWLARAAKFADWTRVEVTRQVPEHR